MVETVYPLKTREKKILIIIKFLQIKCTIRDNDSGFPISKMNKCQEQNATRQKKKKNKDTRE